jgi:CoA:oxalate CoA-transferase
LHGVRVVDLTRVLAGPYCTTLLWELGAEVLKIERPGHGDDTRAFPPFVNGESVYFASINRGKRSLALDLQDAGDRVILEDLVGKADVLVENFRPGAMAKLGYDFDTLHAKHPGLLYCSISGFGHTGPYAERAAYDLIVQALGGMISINGSEGSSGVRLGIRRVCRDRDQRGFVRTARKRQRPVHRYRDAGCANHVVGKRTGAFFRNGRIANTHWFAPSGHHAV